MKTRTPIVTAAFLFLTLNSQLSTAFAQGSLTPPGAPAPTMKSLAQIEPRTPISSAPFNILVSGSYYLTTNVTVSSGDAITILANNVTLDLNGFTISSTLPTAATDSAILLGSVMNVAIFNGHISSGVTNTAAGVFGGGGFGNGIYYSGSRNNLRVKDVSVAGVLYYGIYLNSGLSTVVESCTVSVAGTYGIFADSVSDSTALHCGTDGIAAYSAHNCRGSGIGGIGNGLDVNTANNCSGYSDSGTGLSASIANNSYGYSGFGGVFEKYGLYASKVATGCYGFSIGSGTGLWAFTASNCYGESESGYGLYAFDMANSSYGRSSTGTGLRAFIANSCDGTSLDVAHKYNMP